MGFFANTLAETSTTIYDHQLADAVLHKTVKQIKLKHYPNGTYGVIVNLTWSDNDMILTTSKKTPRKLVSVDRFITALRDKVGDVPPIVISFGKVSKFNN